MPSRASSVSWPDAILAGAIATLGLLAWWALWLWGRSPYGHLLMHGSAHLEMAIKDHWSFAIVFVCGWIVMTIAMMLPTSIPLIVLFQRLVRSRKMAVWLISLLICGYLAVWTLSGTLLQMVNWAIQAGIARVSWPSRAPAIGGAFLLAIAGLYQFSSLKYACLDKCRSPLSFLNSRWRGGNESAQAFRIGVEHGLFCVGCCWSLMLLMFVVGTASLSWMLLLGIVMALEKNLPWGRRLSAPLGVLLIVGAVAVAVAGVRA
jgi:predicted metal-binding membrane protein